MSSIKHPVLTSLIFALIACAGTVSCRQSTDRPDRPATTTQFVVDAITLAPRPIRESLSATGTLLARESVDLRAERAGVVREIRFGEGQPVSAGEVLIVMDDSELQAQLARASAQLELATAVEIRDRSLFDTGALISEAEYEQTLANLGVAGAEKKLIEAQLAKTRIRAPFDGIPGLRQISVGSYLTPGTSICSFQAIDSLRLDFSLPERYLAYVRTGQRVDFRIAGRLETFEAIVTAIEPGIDVATRSLLLRATAPNEGRLLLPGSFAEVEVVLDEIPDAILIPPIALIPGLQRQTVFIHQDGKVEERQVQTGLRTPDAVQILDGLRAGEELITTGILQLRPGMQVRVRPSTDPSQPAIIPNPESGR
jgi:membrane fusion protein, multidrug efflux system